MGLKIELVVLFLFILAVGVVSLLCIEAGTITGQTEIKECDASNLETLETDNGTEEEDERNETHSRAKEEYPEEREKKVVEFRCFTTSASIGRKRSVMKGCTMKNGCLKIKRRLKKANLKQIMCKECGTHLCNSAKKMFFLQIAPLLLLLIAGRVL
ncbi:uncharacterized protein LOC123003830 [Tribolium madens]|uniref:uncharacterized protein LOC123003830 n=1 Tax=Tribolium madens TaxID=41895 RepID=UPI001CF7437D|nr:uncharacterized protein LOC123003830 [Tribolium madens]